MLEWVDMIRLRSIRTFAYCMDVGAPASIGRGSNQTFQDV